MKKLILFFLLNVCIIDCFGYQSDSIHVIPQPVSVKRETGYFYLNASTTITINDQEAIDIAGMTAHRLDMPTGYKLAVTNKSVNNKNVISLELNETPDKILDSAGYKLQVSEQEIEIIANRPRGLFYGLQTLMQLLPPQICSDTVTRNIKWGIPCVNILDYPRFSYRGLMLDVSRHFFTKKEVEEYIDEMAKYKFNILHWHLTDDQGWRIQINGLPKLTKIGAWRVPRTGKWGTFAPPGKSEAASSGGFYTQKDIKEIVQYAAQRFVAILPEIDVPAHSLALIASYPDLSSTQAQYKVWPQYPPGSIDDVLDVANDSTWLILDKIFTQIARLFPYEYIHVGGDEANRSFWMNDPKDIDLMKEKDITSPAGLQSYFEKKLEKLIISKGKKMIGWDEILEGGLAPEAAVMSWRGEKGGIEASEMGHEVVMAPHLHVYLNRVQGNPLIEPAGAAPMTFLKKVYNTKILPEGVNPKFILGGEGCLWSEFIPNYRHLEYMTYPRAWALSEIFWSPGVKHDWNDFAHRVQIQFRYLKAAQVKYSTAIYDPVISAIKLKNGSVKVVLNTQIPGLQLYYTFDGTNPDNFCPVYKEEPLSIPKGASEIRVITYRSGKKIGHQVNCPLTWLKSQIK